MLSTNQRQLISTLLLVVLLAAAYAVDGLRPENEYTVSGQSFDSSVSVQPVLIPTPAVKSNAFVLEFDGLARDGNYDNFLQTSESDRGIRLELQPPNSLVLVLQHDVVIPITKSFELGKWRHFLLHGEKRKFLEMQIDGIVELRIDLESIAARIPNSTLEKRLSNFFEFHFDSVTLGSGFSPPRGLQGAIKNFSLSLRYQTPLPPLLRWVGIAFVTFAVIWLISIGWTVPAVLPQIKTDALVLTILGLLTLLGFAFSKFAFLFGQWNLLLTIGACLFIIPILTLFLRQTNRTRIGYSSSALVAGLPALGMTWALLTLPNWASVAQSFASRQLFMSGCITLALSIATIVCCNLADNMRSNQRSAKLPVLAWVPYAIFAIFAFRIDTLFVGTGESHWEYFVGPIRTVRAGGWLLWDVPSQYGFLNILVAALMPFRSSWNAFYVFQALILFTSASLFYRAFQSLLRGGRIISCAIVIASFFLADPDLIGPSPYPSSSAVRFVWCYVLLYMAIRNFMGDQPSISRFAAYASPAWVAGVLWSAESAVYATTIFWAPIILSGFLNWLSNGGGRIARGHLLRLLGIPLSLLTFTLLGIAVVHLLSIGHMPDVRMHFQYATAYGAGFGSYPISLNGPIWVFALILFIGGSAMRAALQRDITLENPTGAVIAAVACVWVIATYYAGRAFSSNVTAVLPLLCLASATMIRATASVNQAQLGQISAAIPLFALVLLSAFSNPLLSIVVRNLPPFVNDVQHKVRPPDQELASILLRNKIDTTTPVVYYSVNAAMPRSSEGSYEISWLPTPFQLLEEPINPLRRDEIVERFAARNRMSGYLIQELGKVDDRANDWIELISKFYDCRHIYRSDRYRVFYFHFRKPGTKSASATDLLARDTKCQE